MWQPVLNGLMQENKKQAELPPEVNQTAPFPSREKSRKGFNRQREQNTPDRKI
jgi:hypothetical protein